MPEREPSEKGSEQAGSETSQNKYYRRMRSPDLINDVIDTNRALSGRGNTRLRAASQAHQGPTKPVEEPENMAEKQAEAKKFEKELKDLERKLEG